MCGSIWIFPHVHVGAYGGQNMESDALVLDLQAVVSICQ